MASFSALAIGLSFLLGCIVLGLAAELYYFLWWKKRISCRVTEDHYNCESTGAKEPSPLFCWRKSISLNSSDEVTNSVTKTDAIDEHEPDLELGMGGKDLVIKGFGEEGVECEIMRLHNLCGPTRFLFTINEETKEDMESDDGKSRSRKRSRTRSLSDILVTIESTPLASPLKTHFDSYNHHGFNPLFEQLTESELNRLRSSPPPKFKFLRDAEDKLLKRLMEEEAKRKALKDGQRIAAAAATYDDDDDDEEEEEETEVSP